MDFRADSLEEVKNEGIGTSRSTSKGGNRGQKRKRIEQEANSEEKAVEDSWLICGKMTPNEEKFFSVFKPSHLQLYFSLRNSILLMWQKNVQQYLNFTDIQEKFIPEHRKCVERIWDYLNTFGHINCFMTGDQIPETAVQASKRRRVVVIGAGAAGIACARQLHNQGHAVVVLEARGRIGGRCSTLNREEWDGRGIDFGASVVTGVRGNPCSVLLRQAEAKPRVVNRETLPLYTDEGAIDQADEIKVAGYNEVLLKGSEIMKGKCERQQHHIEQVQRISKTESCPDEEDHSYETLEAMSLKEALERVFKVYQLKSITPKQQAVLHWHMAHLEYSCGSSLDDLSLLHWDQDEYEDTTFYGDHVVIEEGYTRLLEYMAADLEIRFNHEVCKVTWGDQRVIVETMMGPEFEADFCICTLPLGVLQKQVVEFSPELPLTKTNALERLGFGNVNKTILTFEKKFWGDEDYFGYCHPISGPKEDMQEDEQPSMSFDSECRGRWFYFWNFHTVLQVPILVAVSSGPGANEVETMSDEEVKNGVLDVLEKIFGDVAKETKLVNLIQTRWGSDPYANGSYSFLRPDCKGRPDIIEIGKALDDTLFFAGEHCSWRYPDTVAGGLVSGLRAAGLILNLDKTYEELEMPPEPEQKPVEAEPPADLKKKKKRKLAPGRVAREEIVEIMQGLEVFGDSGTNDQKNRKTTVVEVAPKVLEDHTSTLLDGKFGFMEKKKEEAPAPVIPPGPSPERSPPPPALVGSPSNSEPEDDEANLPMIEALEDDFYETSRNKKKNHHESHQEEIPQSKRSHESRSSRHTKQPNRKEKIEQKKDHMKAQKRDISKFVKKTLNKQLDGNRMDKTRYKEIAQKVTKKVFNEYQATRKQVDRKKRMRFTASAFFSDSRRGRQVASIIRKYLELR